MRRSALLLSSILLIASCTEGGGGDDEGTAAAGSSTTTIYDYPDASTRLLNRLTDEPRPVDNSAMPPRHLDEERFPEALVERTRIVWGGVAPDAIAPLEDPDFVAAAEVDWLEDDEAVLVLDRGDVPVVYPVQVMLWHEIVNHDVDGSPVTVTYCPLCNSAVAFDRRLDDRVLDFGTSGTLYRSALVMYDRQTESLWTQFDGRAVVGTLVGAELEVLTVTTVSWADVAADHPDALVLSRDTGFDRPYGTNRYGALDTRDEPLSGWFTEEVDPRFPAFERLVGIGSGRDAVAVLTALVAAAGVVDVEVDGGPVTIWHEPGTASPTNAARVADGAEIGANGVYRAEVDGAVLTFRRLDGGGFADDQTGSTWNILGEATAGPMAGTTLEAVPHLDTFWFAWSTHAPDSTVLG